MGVEPKIGVGFYPQNGWWISWKTLWTNGRFGGFSAYFWKYQHMKSWTSFQVFRVICAPHEDDPRKTTSPLSSQHNTCNFIPLPIPYMDGEGLEIGPCFVNTPQIDAGTWAHLGTWYWTVLVQKEVGFRKGITTLNDDLLQGLMKLSFKQCTVCNTLSKIKQILHQLIYS